MEHNKTGVWHFYVFQSKVNVFYIRVLFNFVPIIAHNFIVDSLDLLLKDYSKISRSTSNDILDMKLGET